MPDWLIVWALFCVSFVAIFGAGLGVGYLLTLARHPEDVCNREHTDEVPPDELMRRVGIRDHRAPGPRSRLTRHAAADETALLPAIEQVMQR